jgi:hypothetical protein
MQCNRMLKYNISNNCTETDSRTFFKLEYAVQQMLKCDIMLHSRSLCRRFSVRVLAGSPGMMTKKFNDFPDSLQADVIEPR